MSLVQLFVPTEVAHDTVAELGELGNVQFKDVRVPFYSYRFIIR
jgi:V-type H+-transporting ATPase subunit a